jgi:hypothetical protein
METRSANFQNVAEPLDRLREEVLCKGIIVSRPMTPLQIAQVGPVESLQEFMEAVWRVPKEYGRLRLFRGQADNWPLLPRLFRVNRRPEELTELERRLLDAFQGRCLYLLPSVPSEKYDMMSLAQHYGLRTRLLDWSRNPLMGLFFSVSALYLPAPTVYIYDATLDQLNKGRRLNGEAGIQDREDTLVLSPTPHSQRVVAQAGYHTVHSLLRNDGGVRVQSLENSPGDCKRLTLVTIEPTKAHNIRWELQDMGIHAATVFGDLASVCREIQDDLQIS